MPEHEIYRTEIQFRQDGRPYALQEMFSKFKQHPQRAGIAFAYGIGRIEFEGSTLNGGTGTGGERAS